MEFQDSSSCILWPSIGEYPVYDELLYYAMTQDEKRVIRYRHAALRLVKDKKVVDIGTGKDAILARICIECGAALVYAIEMDEEAFHQASELIKKLNLENKIILMFGNSMQLNIPEQVDVCISEIIGTIGGSEGAAVILNNARRFLKPNGKMIPEECRTLAAAVTLPEQVYNFPMFDELGDYYSEQVFDTVGYSFDIRLCLKNIPDHSVISDSAVIEALDFNKECSTSYTSEFCLTINQNSRLDGLLLWINLFTSSDQMVDSLKEKTNWLPVYFPLFYPGLSVEKGDILKGNFSVKLSENSVNPDYFVKGGVMTVKGETHNFEFESYYMRKPESKNQFYGKLFKTQESN